MQVICMRPESFMENPSFHTLQFAYHAAIDPTLIYLSSALFFITIDCNTVIP